MIRRFGIVASVGLAAVLAIGCSRDLGPADTGSATPDDYTRIDLNQEFGGLTVSDEDVAFADEELAAVLVAEAEGASEDPLITDPEVERLDRMGRDPSAAPDSLRPRLTFLRLRWGHLVWPVDSLESDAACRDPEGIDWTGSLRVDRGLLVVRRVLAFERPGDHLVVPRPDRRTIGLVSRTGDGFDGLVLQIIEHPPVPADSTSAVRPNRLRIDLGPYRAEFAVAELAMMDRFVPVDRCGNGIELTGLRPGLADLCPSGFLEGRYRPLNPDHPDTSAQVRTGVTGRFHGAWRTLDGRVHGFMRGGYGLDRAGERVFVGKYIDTRGRFRGLISGTWDSGDFGGGEFARFAGHWYNAAGTREGVLAGQGMPADGGAGGFLSGRWATACDGDAVGLSR